MHASLEVAWAGTSGCTNPSIKSTRLRDLEQQRMPARRVHGLVHPQTIAAQTSSGPGSVTPSTDHTLTH
eukprot:720053-Pelagomonas_calceolata.AAC.3